MLRDSVLSFCIEADGDEAVTRFDRWPISAPPTPMALAIDSFVTDGASSGEGAAVDVGETVGAEVVAAGAIADVETEGEGEGDGLGADVREGVGAGLESTAKAGPTSPGPTTRAAARTAVFRDCMTGRRD